VRICHITNYYPGFHEHIGGAERATEQMADSLGLAGHENLILSTAWQRQGRSRHRLAEIPTMEDRLPARARLLLEAAKWYLVQFDPLAHAAITKQLRRFRPDLVIFHNCQFLTLSALHACKRMGIPTQMAIYDYWLFCPLTILAYKEEHPSCHREQGVGCLDCLPQTFTSIQRQLLSRRRQTLGWLGSMVDRFIVLSRSSRDILQRRGVAPSRISIVHLCLPDEVPQHEESSCREGSILFVGWIQPRKGLHVVLQAMERVLREDQGATLTVVGGEVKFGADYLRRMEALKGSLGDRIKLLGRVSNQAFQQEMERASLMVVAEQWPNMSPVIVMEAMARAKPVVAGRIGGIPEFIQHGRSGLLVDPGDDHDAFALAMLRLLRDRPLAVKLGLQARQAAQQIFDPRRSQQDLLEAVEAVARRS